MEYCTVLYYGLHLKYGVVKYCTYIFAQDVYSRNIIIMLILVQ